MELLVAYSSLLLFWCLWGSRCLGLFKMLSGNFFIFLFICSVYMWGFQEIKKNYVASTLAIIELPSV